MTNLPTAQTPTPLPTLPTKPTGSRIKTWWWYGLLVAYTIVLAAMILFAPLNSVSDWPILFFLAYMIFAIYLLAKRTVIKPRAPKPAAAPVMPSAHAQDAIPDAPKAE